MYTATYLASLSLAETDALLHDVAQTAKNWLLEATDQLSRAQAAVRTAVALGAFGNYSDPDSQAWTRTISNQISFVNSALISMTGAVRQSQADGFHRDAVHCLQTLEDLMRKTMELRETRPRKMRGL